MLLSSSIRSPLKLENIPKKVTPLIFYQFLYIDLLLTFCWNEHVNSSILSRFDKLKEIKFFFVGNKRKQTFKIYKDILTLCFTFCRYA